MKVLGIETSCDETGTAIYDSEKGLLAHALYSQVSMHQQFGGVVPELASRDHVKKTLPLINEVLQQAKLTMKEIDAIAYTAGPGLMGALFVGASIGRSIGWALQKPTVAIHHMEGHLLAPLLEENPPSFPFLALLVSGGHTMLIDVKDIGQYQLLGETLDDAVGEAFDKTARRLGLPYPGGPALAELAEQGNNKQFRFPRPMTDRPGLDFSFSGIKTAVVNTWHKCDQSQQSKANIAAAFEEAIVDTLCVKCQRALNQTGHKQLVIAGGVSANKHLRQTLPLALTDTEIFFPRKEFCTDNGAMIAFAGYHRIKMGQQEDLIIKVKPRWDMSTI